MVKMSKSNPGFVGESMDLLNSEGLGQHLLHSLVLTCIGVDIYSDICPCVHNESFTMGG